jgi:hypothetical protein
MREFAEEQMRNNFLFLGDWAPEEAGINRDVLRSSSPTPCPSLPSLISGGF